MKYIIEIPDDVQYVLLNGKADNKYYTAVRPVAELEVLNSDYINEHYGELQDEAYQKGINDGSLDVKQRVEGAYQRGLEDAWETAKKIFGYEIDGGLDIDELKKAFGSDVYCTADIIRTNTAEQAIAKLKAYEDKHSDRIEVGDEVIAPCGKAVVTLIETDDLVHYLYSGGDYGCIEPQKLKKTGKHYDIASILEAMRTHD